MYREAERELIRWKDKPHRKPLVVRGARQVGKSYVIQKIGKENFEEIVVVNFEKHQPVLDIFEVTVEPKRILDAIAKYFKVTITPGRTLLFLDEIQLCPKALLALRYFKEELPELHLIVAGSLLEFTLKKADFSLPVGRVEYLYMKPLSFREYLCATKQTKVLDELMAVTVDDPVDEFTHNLLLEGLKDYYELGGMPEVVAHYCKTGNKFECEEIKASIVNVYQNDFGKYDRHVKHDLIEAIFRKAPYIIGEKFKYTKVNPDVKSRDLKPALQALVDAGLLYRVYHTAASGLPFGAMRNDRIFKLLFLDGGLVNYIVNAGTSVSVYGEWPAQNQGMLSEQYVGQELLAYSEGFREAELFFWDREQPGSTSEVDYVMNVGPHIIPIEVKSGKTGRLKSLRQFITEKKSPFGVRISEKGLCFEGGVLSVPLYMVAEVPRLVQSLL